MDRIAKYIDVIIPMHACTLRCSYCYLSLYHHDLSGGLPHFSFDAPFFRKALSQKRLGGCARINFCGDGETLLVPHLVDYVSELLEEGHWVDIVTNGTVSKVMKQLAALDPSYTERIFLKISLHYIELKKHNLLDEFFLNIDTIRKAGISFTLLLTGSDDYVPYIDEIKDACFRNVGALPHISFARNDTAPAAPLQSKFDRVTYTTIWKQFDSPLFDFQSKIFGEKRHEFCMGGAWTFALNMVTGELRQCHISILTQNIYEDINKPIHLKPIGHFCKTSHCLCGPIWLTLGAIPSMTSPNYLQMRNRRCIDGTEWLTEVQKESMSQKLSDNNPLPNMWEMIVADAYMWKNIYIPKFQRKLRKILQVQK